MGVTISTHNGSSISREHNVRNRKVTNKESHIDPNGVYEVWHDEAMRSAYERLFGEAVAEYNAKQNREDRQIKNYYKKVQEDSKKHTAYEMIIGIYGKDENGNYLCPESTGKEILRQFVDEWKERNPNLELIGAYYHADEPDAQPHVHIDYIPVGHDYKNGPSIQNGLVKALGEMGFEKKGKATAQIQWEQRENSYLDNLCRKRGLEVDHPREQKEHVHTSLLKAHTELEALKSEKEVVEGRLEPLRAEYEVLKSLLEQVLDQYREMYPEGIKRPNGIQKYVKVPKEAWESRFLSANERSLLEKALDNVNQQIMKLQHTDLGKQNTALREELEKVYGEKYKYQCKAEELEQKLSNIENVIGILPEYYQHAVHRALEDRKTPLKKDGVER